MLAVDSILEAIGSQRVLVVGDICLDRWCTYDPELSEPSRETGIPRVAVTAVETTPGAGGTIANNLTALGAGSVSVLGVTGDDGFGWELRRALAARQIDHSLLIASPRFHTFTYTKLLNGHTGEEDRPRVDFVNTSNLPEHDERQLLDRLSAVIPDHDVILVSDQAETTAGGVITTAVRETLADLAERHPEKVFWVDSRLRPELFRHVIVKPNEEEAHRAMRRLDLEGFGDLRELTLAPFLAVTHGERGVLLVEQGRETWVPTRPNASPVDICGAGDSFSAGAALAYQATRNAVTAARFGNLVASVTITKKGTGTASPEEVRAAAALAP